MRFKEFFRSKAFLYILSFIAPLSILLCVFAILDIAPVGTKLFLVNDLSGQYVSFLSYLKDMSKNGNDFFYSFSQVLGLDMLGTAAYYLFSPFNLLLFLIKDTALAATWIILLKISLCSVTFFHFISKKSEVRPSNLMFSLAYSLMAYNIAYSHNLMWLDGVIILPIIVMGIDKIISKKSPALYFISLSAAIFSNYYIGYMLCLFSLLYFCGRFILNLDSVKAIKNHIRVILNFTFSSLFAGAVNAFFLVPTYLSVSDSAYTPDVQDTFSSFIAAISNVLMGVYDVNHQHYITANLFCGTITFLLMGLYFFNKQISKKEKIVTGIGLLFLFSSVCVYYFNFIWHGFSTPRGFPNRHTFIIAFVIVVLAWRCFRYKKGITNAGYFIVGGFFTILIVILAFTLKNYPNLDWRHLIYAFVTASIFLTAMHLGSRFFSLIMPLIIVLDLSANVYLTFSQFEIIDKSGYDSYIQSTEAAAEKVKQHDDSFYRTEKTFYRHFLNSGTREIALNDSMQFSYNSITSFSSNQKPFVRAFFHSIGYTVNQNWVTYKTGNTRTTDALFGIKYVLDDTHRFDGIYDIIEEADGISVYKNNNALPIAFSAGEKVTANYLQFFNVFESQNVIFNNITGRTEKILTPAVSVTENPANFAREPESSIWTKQYPEQYGFIDYTITAHNARPLYVYLPSSAKIQNVELKCNGEDLGIYFDFFENGVLYLGTFSQGEEVTFRVICHDSELIMDTPLFYFENLDLLESYTDEIKMQGCNLEQISSSHLKGEVTISEENQYLVFTVPYQDGWEVFVSGEKQETETALDTLLAVKIGQGEHTIEIKYTPPGLKTGVTITISAIILAAFWAIYGIIKINSAKRKLTN